MKKYFTIVILLLFIINKVSAQSYAGYRTGSFSGIHGALYNPACLADNRLKYDFNLVSTSISFGNNFITINNKALFNPKLFGDEHFKRDYLSADTSSGKTKNAYINLDILGPSFYAAISDKDAIGFYIRTRGMVNIDGIDQGTANLIWRDLLDSEIGKPFSGDLVGVNENVWTEYAVPYARVVMNDGRNMVKVGATLKLLQGISSAFVSAKDYTYTHLNRDTIIDMSADVQYGHTENQFWGKDPFKFKFEQAGIGVDLGVIYEFRPDYETIKYELDGKKDLLRKDIESYKLKLGFSITDIGTVVYKKSTLSRNYDDNTAVFDLDLFKNLANMEDLDVRVSQLPNNAPASDKGKFSMNLPLAMNLFIDYNAGKNFFLNLNPIIAFKTGDGDVNKTHYFTSFTLTPRWDTRWFGVFLPIDYNNYLKFNMGLSLRLGPVFVGSGTILSNLGKGETKGSDFHAGVKIFIPYPKPKDKDKDGVSDALDLCPNVKGTWETKGCPDRDHDGIVDTEDKCPDVAGLKEMKGCPDRDSDGVTDADDACPDLKGLRELSGCPDKDLDGIADKDDKCPDLLGPKDKQGCPDRDNDGVIDPDDACPDLAGLVENHGCPFKDADADGIKDQDDKCPNDFGPVENGGCPYSDIDKDGVIDKEDKCPSIPGLAVFQGCPDTDKDGIPDGDDHCPTIPGVVANFGCPEIKEEEKAILKTAFDNLEFETGKSIIRATSFKSLDDLATLLKGKSEYKLLIEGNTDNVGKRDANMLLSKNRSNAVKKYLMSRGVPEDQLRTKWYGPDKPIDTNDTPEGRQHNRRVEMNIIFE